MLGLCHEPLTPAVPATVEGCAEAFYDRLLLPRGPYPDHITATFAELHPRAKVPDEGADILSHHLFGFDIDDGHKFENLSHSALGAINEALMTIPYDAAMPGELSRDWDTLIAALPKDLRPGPQEKPKAEYFLRDTAREKKYRHGSFDGLTKQKRTAKWLTRMGKRPIMMILRPSPNTPTFVNGGWECFEGQRTIDLITAETGVSIEKVVARVSGESRITELRAAGREAMFGRVRDICVGYPMRYPEEVAAPIIDRLLQDPDMRRMIVSRL